MFLKKIYRKLYPKRKFFGLNQLDQKLLKYLDFNNGFFVEVGANDGIKQSNTLYFERYMNWHGILIEPIPKLAEKCKKNRPNCIVENFALVSKDFNNSYIDITYCDLMSTVKGAFESIKEQQHINKGAEIQNVYTYDIKVPVITLSKILSTHEITDFDFLSLDVEGYELEVLKGIDFDVYKPKWMLIEVRNQIEIDNFLKSYYKPVSKLTHHDILYTRILN